MPKPDYALALLDLDTASRYLSDAQEACGVKDARMAGQRLAIVRHAIGRAEASLGAK